MKIKHSTTNNNKIKTIKGKYRKIKTYTSLFLIQTKEIKHDKRRNK